MKHTIDSIIFDLDGTLWDSTATITVAWQRALDEIGYTDLTITADLVRNLAGMQYDAIYDKLFPNLKGEERERLQSLCAKYELEMLQEQGGKLYPGLEETLAYLKEKYELAIVSNCQSGYIETFLQRHNMQAYFNDHECYGTKLQPKAENIREVIKRNGLKQAIYIGDTTGDFEASQKAEVPFILAGYGFGEVDADVKVIHQFSDLKNLF